MVAPHYDPMSGSFLPVTSSVQAFPPTTSEALSLTPTTTGSFGHHHVPSHLPMLPPDNSGINTALSHPTHPASSSTSHPAPTVNQTVSRRLMSQWLERQGSNWASLDPNDQDRVEQAEHMLVAESDHGCIKLGGLFICSNGETFAGPSDRWGTDKRQYRRINLQVPAVVGAILSGAIQTEHLPTDGNAKSSS